MNMSCLKSLVKALTTVIGLCLQLVCQASLLVIISSKTNTDENVWYLSISIILITPEVISVVKSIWSASFIANGRYKEWPLLGPFLLGVLFSLLEGAAMPFLLTCILPLLPVYLIPLLLNGCFIIQLMFETRNKALEKEVKDKIKSPCIRFLQLLFIVTTVLSFCGVGAFVYKTKLMTSFESAMLPLTLALLSIVWFRPLRMKIHGENEATFQNSSILYPVLKIIFICVSLYKITDYKNIDLAIFKSPEITTVFKHLQETDIFWYVIAHVISGFLLQYYRFIQPKTLSSALSMIIPCVVSPIFLTVASVILCIKGGVTIFPVSQCVMSGTLDFWLLYIVTILIYIIPPSDVTIRSWRAYRDYSVTMETVNNQHSIYNSVFMPQTLLESLYPVVDNVTTSIDNDDIQSLPSRKYRIFICTTMYQEAQHEMDRLLKSLSKIADSKKLKNHGIYIESHIFLDNGANGFEIKEFGVQLLALMEDNFEFCKEPGTILHTPYGIQLSWERNPEMSLFIHLKDNGKVKAKKRWSQVMYMKYVLEYRSKVVGDGSKFKPVLKSNSAYSLFHNSTESLDQGIDMRMFTTYRRTNTDTEILVDGSEDNTMHTLQVPKVVFGNSSDTSSVHSLIEDGSESGIQFSVDDEVTQSRQETGSLDRESNESVLEPPSRNLSRWASSVNIPTISADVDFDNKDEIPDMKSFILSTDADMAFDDECVLDLLNSINKYPDIGGVCGRTFPIGVHQHPIVWLQMFDYAKDFWMIKSAQNIIGSVMCCPGCLSLYRFQAVRDVLQTYSESTQTMEDVFTKDNGEDRWMCTLMMLKGWELRYTYHGRNTTYCPEETVEFMKQRRRWLLSDFANAAVVLRNLKNLMARNNAFTFIYIVYLIQLFLIMILYPGSTIIMLSLGLELASGLPLIIATPVLAFVPVFYCVILMHKVRPDIEITIAKLLIFILGVGTLYIFTATSVIVVRDVYDDYQTGNISHIEHMILIAFMGSYIYAALLHPGEAWILICGLPYLFYLPLLNIFLPLYAVCNIVDQSWGTRDGQKAKIPNVLRFPKVGRKKKKLVRSLTGKASSYASLSSSAPDLTDYNETETEFWTKLVKTLVGKDVNISISGEERDVGLHKLRKKALAIFLAANGVWILLLCGFYAFLLQLLDNKSTYGIVMGALMGLSPLIQLCGMTVYRFYDTFSNFGHMVSR